MSDNKVGVISVYGEKPGFAETAKHLIAELITRNHQNCIWDLTDEAKAQFESMKEMFERGAHKVVLSSELLLQLAHEKHSRMNISYLEFERSLLSFHYNILGLSNDVFNYDPTNEPSIVFFTKGSHRDDLIIYKDHTANLTYVIYENGAIDIISCGPDFDSQKWEEALAMAGDPALVNGSVFYSESDYGKIGFAIRIPADESDLQYITQGSLGQTTSR